MTLSKELKNGSFVLLAKKPNEFIPADFNQYWLDSNDIISAKSIVKDSSFSPFAVQAANDQIALMVTSDQIQVAPIDLAFFKTFASENLVRFVQNMNETDLGGLGLNFNWYLFDDAGGFEEVSRKFFYNPSNPGSAYFGKEDAIFGDYISKEIETDIRLKLDIKPVHLFDLVKNDSTPCVQFSFNFHSDLKIENQKDKIIYILTNYDKWYGITKDIMALYK